MGIYSEHMNMEYGVDVTELGGMMRVFEEWGAAVTAVDDSLREEKRKALEAGGVLSGMCYLFPFP